MGGCRLRYAYCVLATLHTITHSGNALCALSDRLSMHMVMLMSCYIGVTALQTVMMLFSSFSAQLLLAIASAAVSSPWGVISDAAVMAAVPRVCIFLCMQR